MEVLRSNEKERAMSLKPQSIGPLPEETARVAHAAYPKGNIYMQVRDVLGTIYEDEQFAALFPQHGQPAEASWRLALVSVMQFMEGLSDRQAADAVRGRLDWKYALGLELSDPGFDHTALVEFRQWRLTGKSELLLFELLLTQLREGGYLKARGRQRSDSTHVLAKIRAPGRVEGIGETFHVALNSLAVAAPKWLKGQLQEDWGERYAHRVEDYHLPTGKHAREDYAVVIGQDGSSLLCALYATEEPGWLREIPAVQTLRRVWVQHFSWEVGELRWRDASNVPPTGDCLDSPYDPQAHYVQKRSTSWVGYKVHLTETCDDALPHLLTHVETTPAPLADDATVPLIHEALAARYCQAFTSWIRAMWMLRNSSPASSSMAWIFSGRPERIIAGKRAKGQGSPPSSFSSVGNMNVLSARQGRPVAVGRLPRIGEATRSLQSNLRCRTAVPVRAASSVPTVNQLRHVGCSRCVRTSSISPCKPHANDKPLRRSKPYIRRELGLKGRFHKAFAPSDYGTRATADRRKSISSTSSRLPRSISAGCMPGSLSSRERQHGKPPWCDSLKNELKWMSLRIRHQCPKG